MKEGCSPACRQDVKNENISHTKLDSNVFNASCVGNVAILTDGYFIKYKIEYMGKPLEFDYKELLTERIFNMRCLSLGLLLISKRYWNLLMNTAIDKAVKYDELDYPPYVESATKFCKYLLGDLVDGDSLIDCHYSHPALLRYKCDLNDDLLARILKRNGITVADEFKQVKDTVFVIWTLDPVKLKEFVKWKGN